MRWRRRRRQGLERLKGGAWWDGGAGSQGRRMQPRGGIRGEGGEGGAGRCLAGPRVVEKRKKDEHGSVGGLVCRGRCCRRCPRSLQSTNATYHASANLLAPISPCLFWNATLPRSCLAALPVRHSPSARRPTILAPATGPRQLRVLRATSPQTALAAIRPPPPRPCTPTLNAGLQTVMPRHPTSVQCHPIICQLDTTPAPRTAMACPRPRRTPAISPACKPGQPVRPQQTPRETDSAHRRRRRPSRSTHRTARLLPAGVVRRGTRRPGSKNRPTTGASPPALSHTPGRRCRAARGHRRQSTHHFRRAARARANV